MMADVRKSPTIMNSTITFPAPLPALKLPRLSCAQPSEEKWATKLAEERRRLHEDHEALRVREENLRDYEDRLRALQSEIEAVRAVPIVTLRTATPFVRPSSKAPFEGGPALQAAWEKFHRARELLETEQTHMRDERIIVQEKENDLKRREKAVAEREARVGEHERLIAEAVEAEAPQPIASEHTMSAVTRLTRAPFDIARSVFGGKK